MARKLNTSKPPRLNNVAPETLNRRSQPPAPTLYLMQLRAQAVKITPPDCIRLEVTAEIDTEDDEQPVKIVWVNDDQ